MLDTPDHATARHLGRGLRRTLGTAPRRQARPLGLAEIRQIVTGIDRATPKGARDAAIILLGFASALRRSELTALTLLVAWTAVRGNGPGPLFTSLRHGVVTDEPISGEAVARMLRTRARAAGLSTERITGHSLPAGHASTAALAGVGLDRIAAQTRHRRLSTLIERYIRPMEALQMTSSRDLGL